MGMSLLPLLQLSLPCLLHPRAQDFSSAMTSYDKTPFPQKRCICTALTCTGFDLCLGKYSNLCGPQRCHRRPPQLEREWGSNLSSLTQLIDLFEPRFLHLRNKITLGPSGCFTRINTINQNCAYKRYRKCLGMLYKYYFLVYMPHCVAY